MVWDIFFCLIYGGMKKNGDKILMANEYALAGEGLGFVDTRLDMYEDFLPYFPVIGIEELARNGLLASNSSSDSFGLVVGQDFSLGAGFFLESPDYRFWKQESQDILHQALVSVLSMLRFGERLQFDWMVADQMDPLFELFASTKDDDNPLVKFVRKKRYARDRALFETGDLRQFVSSCYLQVPYSGRFIDIPKAGGFMGKVSSFIDGLFNSFSLLKTATRGGYATDILDNLPLFLDRFSMLESSLNKCPGLITTPVHKLDYMKLYRRLLDPDGWIRDGGTVGVGNLDLAPDLAQCFSSRISDFGSYFSTGSFYHRVLTVDVPPQFTDIAVLIASLVRPEILSEINNIQTSVTLTPRDAKRELGNLKRKRDFMMKQIRDKPAKTAGLQEIVKDINAQILTLENDELACLFSTNLVIHLWESDVRKLVKAEAAVVNQLRDTTTMGMKAEELNSLPYMLSYCLPGCPGKGDKHREMSLTGVEAAPLAPMIGQGQGILAKVEKPLVPTLFWTDLQVPFSFDFFARKRVLSYSGVIIGGMGSGKSFLLNSILAGYSNRKTRIIIIDAAVGAPAYKTACRLLRGNYVGKDFCLNALGTDIVDGLARPPNEVQLRHILATLEGILQPRSAGPMLPEAKAFLTECVNYLFENPPSAVPYLRDLPDAIERCAASRVGTKYEEFAKDFCQILRSGWTFPGGANSNAPYVDGADDLSDSWLTVFDLKWALDSPDFLTVFMTLIFRYIDKISLRNELLPESEREQIIVGTDEGWKVLLNPSFAELYMGLYKASRSRNIASFLLTQDFSDLMKALSSLSSGSEDVKSSPIINQSTHFIIGRMPLVEAQQIGEVLGLPEIQASKLTTLKREPGKYTEYAYLTRLASGTQDSSPLNFVRLRFAPLLEELVAYGSESSEAGERLTFERQLVDDLRVPSKRAEYFTAMEAEGWDVAQLSGFSDEDLLPFVMVFAVARKQREVMAVK